MTLANERAKAQAQRITMLAVMRDSPQELYPGVENGRCWEVKVDNNSDGAIRDVNVGCDPYGTDAVWNLLQDAVMTVDIDVWVTAGDRPRTRVQLLPHPRKIDAHWKLSAGPHIY